jgi:hypothetical protein
LTCWLSLATARCKATNIQTRNRDSASLLWPISPTVRNDVIEYLGVSELVLAILIIGIVHVSGVLTLRRRSGRSLTASLSIFNSRLFLSFSIFSLALELLLVKI